IITSPYPNNTANNGRALLSTMSSMRKFTVFSNAVAGATFVITPGSIVYRNNGKSARTVRSSTEPRARSKEGALVFWFVSVISRTPRVKIILPSVCDTDILSAIFILDHYADFHQILPEVSDSFFLVIPFCLASVVKDVIRPFT